MDLEYWTAAGVLIVHAAIAYADALCIQQAGVRSGADNHEEAAAILEQVVPTNEAAASAIGHLRRIIEEKTRVSYLGELYSRKQTNALWNKLDRFRSWAKRILHS